MLAAAAGLGPAREGRLLLPADYRRPADVLVLNWAGGKDAALDLMPQAAFTPGLVLTHAYGRKMRGAEEVEDCRKQGIAFIPMAVESFGCWHCAAEAEVRKLGAALARHTGQDEGEAVHHLWGRLGILLQRGNAAILGNRVPSFPAPEIDGVME